MLFYEEKNDYLIVNENVATYRKIRGYKQSDIADILDMKQSTYSQMERKGNIPAMTLWHIAKILDVPIQNFFDNSHANQPDDPFNPEEFSPLTNKEKGAITIIRNLSKPKQDEVYDFIAKKYHRK